MIRFIWPKANQSNYHAVKDDPGDVTGRICVTVLTNQDDTGSRPKRPTKIQPKAGNNAASVQVKNYTDPSQIPNPGDPIPVDAHFLDHDPSGPNLWSSAYTTGVAFDINPPGAPNTILAWATYPNGKVEGYVSQNYRAVLANEVLCGSGSGSGSFMNRTIPTAAALSLAPLEWELDARGFKGAAKIFSGMFRLRFRNDVLDACVWDNHDQKPRRGQERPFVELRCEIPVPATWRLTLKYRNLQVEYAQAALRWNSMGSANSLGIEICGTLPVCNLPRYLTIKPA